MQILHAAIRNQGASIKTLEIQIEKISNVLQERGFGSIRSSTKANLRDQVQSISTTVEADSYPICRMGYSQYAVSTRKNRTPMYETRQMKIPFPSRLNGYYCNEKKGSYGPQFSEAYPEASQIDNSIPKKEKDLGSFTLPCFINNVCFENALVDLGANVSVMPLSSYLNLGIGELAYTKLTVELAYRIVKYLKGIVENVLVGIGKFVFPIDFIILDMLEDIKVPLILERPCLSTGRAKIDVFKRMITLRVGVTPPFSHIAAEDNLGFTMYGARWKIVGVLCGLISVAAAMVTKKVMWFDFWPRNGSSRWVSCLWMKEVCHGVDLTGDEDLTGEDGDIGMGDSTGVSTSLGGEIISRGKKSWESTLVEVQRIENEAKTMCMLRCKTVSIRWQTRHKRGTVQWRLDQSDRDTGTGVFSTTCACVLSRSVVMESLPIIGQSWRRLWSGKKTIIPPDLTNIMVEYLEKDENAPPT
ncbi:hypothetical protein Tco_1300465 [Tanacetum coccineum]